jgi:hypothetical protein
VDDELAGPTEERPTTWRDRFIILWEAHREQRGQLQLLLDAHHERERRRRIYSEWRRGLIQVVSMSAGILGLAKLVWELSRSYLGR